MWKAAIKNTLPHQGVTTLWRHYPGKGGKPWPTKHLVPAALPLTLENWHCTKPGKPDRYCWYAQCGKIWDQVTNPVAYSMSHPDYFPVLLIIIYWCGMAASGRLANFAKTRFYYGALFQHTGSVVLVRFWKRLLLCVMPKVHSSDGVLNDQ